MGCIEWRFRQNIIFSVCTESEYLPYFDDVLKCLILEHNSHSLPSRRHLQSCRKHL